MLLSRFLTIYSSYVILSFDDSPMFCGCKISHKSIAGDILDVRVTDEVTCDVAELSERRKVGVDQSQGASERRRPITRRIRASSLFAGNFFVFLDPSRSAPWFSSLVVARVNGFHVAMYIPDVPVYIWFV